MGIVNFQHIINADHHRNKKCALCSSEEKKKKNVRIHRNSVIEQTVGNVVLKVKEKWEKEIHYYPARRWPSWLDVLGVNAETRVLTAHAHVVTTLPRRAVPLKWNVTRNTHRRISYGKKSPHRLEVNCTELLDVKHANRLRISWKNKKTENVTAFFFLATDWNTVK